MHGNNNIKLRLLVRRIIVAAFLVMKLPTVHAFENERLLHIVVGNTPCKQPMVEGRGVDEKWLDCIKSESIHWKEIGYTGAILFSPAFHKAPNPTFEQLASFSQKADFRIIPSLGTKLWNIPADKVNPALLESVYHDEVPFSVLDGEIKALGQTVPLISLSKSEVLNSWQTKGLDIKWTEIGWYEITPTLIGSATNNMLLLPANLLGRTQVDIKPGYYELYIEAKVIDGKRVPLTIGVEQYDAQGKRRPALNKYPKKINLNDSMRGFWLPVFVAEGSSTIELKLRLRENVGAGILLKDLQLLPMSASLCNLVERNGRYIVALDAAGKNVSQLLELTIRPPQDQRLVKKDQLKCSTLKLVDPNSELGVFSLSFSTLPLQYISVPVTKFRTGDSAVVAQYGEWIAALYRDGFKTVMVPMDEHQGGMNRDIESRKKNLSNRELLFQHLYGLAKKARRQYRKIYKEDSAGLDGKVLYWDDMSSPYSNGASSDYQLAFGGIEGASGLTQQQAALLPDNLMPIAWWYHEEDKKGIVKNTPEWYGRASRDYFYGVWDKEKNWQLWSGAAEFSSGVVVCTWNKTYSHLTEFIKTSNNSSDNTHQ